MTNQQVNAGASGRQLVCNEVIPPLSEPILVLRELILVLRELTLVLRELTLVPRELTLVLRELTLVPRELILARRELILVPGELILVPTEPILLASEPILLARELILVRREVNLVAREAGPVDRNPVGDRGGPARRDRVRRAYQAALTESKAFVRALTHTLRAAKATAEGQAFNIYALAQRLVKEEDGAELVPHVGKHAAQA